jgi:hypothetical protein
MNPSEINDASMNDAADFYFKYMGVNVTYADTKNKTTNVKWGLLQNGPLLPTEHERIKNEGKYNDGLAIVLGQFWNNPLMEGKFLNCVDLDNKAAVDEFCTRGNKIYSLEELAEIFPIEQHDDDLNRAHVYIITDKRPLTNKAPNRQNDPNIPAMDIKSKGLAFATPSYHMGGFRYQFRYGLKPIEEYESHDPDKIENFLDNICKKYGLRYLDEATTNGNGAAVPIDNGEKWYEGERNDKLYRYACSIFGKLWNNTPMGAIESLVHSMNKSRCVPPLPEYEVKQICTSAEDFILKKGNSQQQENNNGNNKEDEKQKKQIQVAFDTVKKQAHKLFIDEYGQAHVAITIQDHLEIFSIDSNKFKDWYRMFIYEQEENIMTDETINKLCSLARAYSASSKYGEQINLNLRTASTITNNQLEWVYDLTNKDWSFVKITSEGWYIIKNDVIFRRYGNQKPQVTPDQKYDPDIFDRFMKLVNIKTDDKSINLLLRIYIISLFIPDIQKVILMLHGSGGAAKTFLEEMIKTLVDPSIPLTVSLPRDKNQLIQQLSHNHVAYYDNISIITPWISDELCRAVTGSGSSIRKLFTDDDDIIRFFKRCVGFNGINLAATKADLLDRGLIVQLEQIDEELRRNPTDMWKEFEELRPQLLGYILDILVKVLKWKNDGGLKLNKLPRMAEFAEYGEMISRCMGYKDDEFINAYTENRELQSEEVIESSQIATCLIYLMFEKYKDYYIEGKEYNDKNYETWKGTASQLLDELNNIAMSVDSLHIDIQSQYWPQAANSLRRRLNEILPTLKQADLIIEFSKDPDSKRTKVINIRKVSSEPSYRPKEQN